MQGYLRKHILMQIFIAIYEKITGKALWDDEYKLKK